MKRLVALVLCLLLIPTAAYGQGDGYGDIVQEAIQQTAENCVGLGVNEICFGHASVAPMVNLEGVPEFDTSGEMMPINEMCAVELGALTAEGQWGMATMNVQPTDSTVNMSYVIFGGLQLQNAASARTQIQVQINTPTDIRSGPGSDFESLGVLEVGAEVTVNACEGTRLWMRLVMEDGRVGWLPSGNITVLGDVETLPVVERDTPIYASMQAFSLHTGSVPAEAAGVAPEDGMLIQVPAGSDVVPVWINGVDLRLAGTVYVRAQLGGVMTIMALAGEVHATANEFTVHLPPGTQATIAFNADGIVEGLFAVTPYADADVAALPVRILPEMVEVASPLNPTMPMIVGLEKCNAMSRLGPTDCHLHFINPDGDDIVLMDVAFVSAPSGEWTASRREPPVLLDGTYTSGQLAWDVMCSTGDCCFIGPIIWNITITDAAGNVSAPFEAFFNCVNG